MARRRKPGTRDVHGILLLDKPAGCTSNQALQRVKWLFKAAKAGHTGSLDPLATGLLPICFGGATKLSTYLLESDKRYRVRARLGARTATADSEGEIVAVSDARPDAEALQAVLPRFRGEILQMPPMYSALKHEGKRLYQLARAGQEVERTPRTVTIHALELVACGDDWFELDVRCSKGTYVRVLVEDVAAAAGALAHVVALHRTEVAPFADAAMVTLDTVESASESGPAALDALLVSPVAAFEHWPRVEVDADRAYYLLRGQAVRVADAPSSGQVVVLGPGGELLGVAEINADGMVAPKRWL
jgi:tRNA pseudouridine55 synthase